MKKNESGFVAVEAVLVIIIVALVGAVGWLEYKNNHKTTRTSSTTISTKSASSSNTKSSKTTSYSIAGPSINYFTIKEWGVRAPYTGHDTYTYTLSNDDNLATVISKDLAAKDSGCSTYGAGQIRRLMPSDGTYSDGTGPTVAQAAQSNPGQYSHVGGYYYQFIHDQAECGNVAVQDQNQANSVVQALVTNLQAAPN